MQLLVLEDFSAAGFSASAGSVIDISSLQIDPLQAAGLATVPFSTDMAAAITAFLVQRAGNPRARMMDMLSAFGLLGSTGAGSRWFVDPDNGSDVNTGLSLGEPLRSMDAALARCTTVGDRTDIFVVGSGAMPAWRSRAIALSGLLRIEADTSLGTELATTATVSLGVFEFTVADAPAPGVDGASIEYQYIDGGGVERKGRSLIYEVAGADITLIAPHAGTLVIGGAVRIFRPTRALQQLEGPPGTREISMGLQTGTAKAPVIFGSENREDFPRIALVNFALPDDLYDFTGANWVFSGVRLTASTCSLQVTNLYCGLTSFSSLIAANNSGEEDYAAWAAWGLSCERLRMFGNATLMGMATDAVSVNAGALSVMAGRYNYLSVAGAAGLVALDAAMLKIGFSLFGPPISARQSGPSTLIQAAILVRLQGKSEMLFGVECLPDGPDACVRVTHDGFATIGPGVTGTGVDADAPGLDVDVSALVTLDAALTLVGGTPGVNDLRIDAVDLGGPPGLGITALGPRGSILDREA